MLFFINGKGLSVEAESNGRGVAWSWPALAANVGGGAAQNGGFGGGAEDGGVEDESGRECVVMGCSWDG